MENSYLSPIANKASVINGKKKITLASSSILCYLYVERTDDYGTMFESAC